MALVFNKRTGKFEMSGQTKTTSLQGSSPELQRTATANRLQPARPTVPLQSATPSKPLQSTAIASRIQSPTAPKPQSTLAVNQSYKQVTGRSPFEGITPTTPTPTVSPTPTPTTPTPTPTEPVTTKQSYTQVTGKSPFEETTPTTPIEPTPDQLKAADDIGVAGKKPTPTISPLQSQLTALQGRITTALTPTAEEQQLRQQISGIIGRTEAGIAGAADRPIPLPFIRGQQAAIERTGAIKLGGLQRQLGLEMEKRTGGLPTMQAEMEFIQQQQNFELNLISTLLKLPEGQDITIGEKVYKGLAPEEEIEPFFTSTDLVSIMKELPAGETTDIVDPNTGDLITLKGLAQPDDNTQTFKSVNQNSGTETFTTINKVTGEIVKQVKSIGTGAVYKPTGGAGVTPTGDVVDITAEQLSPLAKAIYNGTLSLKDITPTQRGEVAPELDAVGWSSAVKNEQKADFATTKSGMDAVLVAWKGVPNYYKGYLQGYLGNEAAKWDERVAKFNASKGIVGMQLTRLFEKGRISDQDRIFYMSLMPNLRMNEQAAVAGAKELQARLDEKLLANLREVNEFISTGGEGTQTDDIDTFLNSF